MYRCRKCRRWWHRGAERRGLSECRHDGEREATEAEVRQFKAGYVDVDMADLRIDDYDPSRWVVVRVG